MPAAVTRPYASENFFPRLLRQIQIQNDQLRAALLARVYPLDEIDRALAILDQDQFASDGMMLQCFPDQAGVSWIVFHQQNTSRFGV